MMEYISSLIENEDDNQSTGLRGVGRIVVDFQNPDEATIAADGLKDVKNYGKFINQFQSMDPKLKKYLSDTFGPPIPTQRKKALQKRREELNDPNFEFKTKTGESIINTIKDYFLDKPSKSIITFDIKDDKLVIPIDKNTLSKPNIKDILKTVLKNIGIKGFKMKETSELDEYQMGVELSPGSGKGKGGRRYIPKFLEFPYAKVKSKLPGEFKIASKINSEGEKEYLLYASKSVKTALDQITRGRTSRETEKQKFDITKTIEDVLPPIVRGAIKKGLDGTKLTKVGTEEMYLINWPIISLSKDKNILYLKGPGQFEGISEDDLKEIITSIISEKKMTSAQKKKRGEIYDALVDDGMSPKKAGPIATAKAMSESILSKLQENTDSDKVKEAYDEIIELINNKARTLSDDNQVSELHDKLQSFFNRLLQEDLDIGHQDDEPDMLKQNVFEIASYAKKLYKLLNKYDKLNTEVDFPHWWQANVIKARELISKATHYLEFEDMQPTLDSMIREEKKTLNELINEYFKMYLEDDDKVNYFIEKFGSDAEKVMYSTAVKKAKQTLNESKIPLNNPALARFRAEMEARKKKAAEPEKSINPNYAAVKNADKIRALKQQRAQIMIDMEQEAEPEGGPIADRYGDMLNKIDAKIAKLQGRKEMDYDTAVGKKGNEYMSKDEIERRAAMIKEDMGVDHMKIIDLVKSADNPQNLSIYYNSDHDKVNIGGTGYDKGDLVRMFNLQPGQSSDVKSLFYKANQNAEDVVNAINNEKAGVKAELKYGYGKEPFVTYKKVNSLDEKAKPDFLDLDGDGNTEEPMKKAAKDAKKATTKKHKKTAHKN